MYALFTLSWCSFACCLIEFQIFLAVLGDLADSEEREDAAEVVMFNLACSTEERELIDSV